MKSRRVVVTHTLLMWLLLLTGPGILLPSASVDAAVLPPAAGTAKLGGGVTRNAADSHQDLDLPAAATDADSIPDTGQNLIEEGLSIDIVAAEAAARPAALLPTHYAVKGVIDPQSALFSEEPGVLVPLAQSKSHVGDWLAAVEAAGPSTPLSDPMFAGTVFIPGNEAFEKVYPQLRSQRLQGKAVGEVFDNSSTAGVALQINCLTVPGAALTLEELYQGRLLQTAGCGPVKVFTAGSTDRPAQLQHRPSGVCFSIIEADLQSGSATAHVVDVLPPVAALQQQGASRPAGEQQVSHYRSVWKALLDPARQLQAFSLLVQRAGLTGLLNSSSNAFTLFAPSEQAMNDLMQSLPLPLRQRLFSDASLADAFVSSHLVLGTALGSKALQALLPGGQLRSPLGLITVSSGTEQSSASQQQLPSGAAAMIVEAAKVPADTPTRPEAAAAATDAASATAEASLAAAAPGDSGSTAAAAAAAGSLPKSLRASQLMLRVAAANVLVRDLVGGKAVVHVIDRVLMSPALSKALGLPISPGYTHLDPPPAPAHSSSGAKLPAGVSVVNAVLAAAFAALLLRL